MRPYEYDLLLSATGPHDDTAKDKELVRTTGQYHNRTGRLSSYNHTERKGALEHRVGNHKTVRLPEGGGRMGM